MSERRQRREWHRRSCHGIATSMLSVTLIVRAAWLRLYSMVVMIMMGWEYYWSL